MKILIDALTMSWKFDNVANLIEQLGLGICDLQPTRCRFYNTGYYYDGIIIYFNQNELNEISDTMLQLSGTGCRTVEELTRNTNFDWLEFLYSYDDKIRSKQAHISRIDIACDLTDGSIPIELIQKYSRAELYVCKSKCLPDVRYMRTEEVYFGSPRSDRILRIYNKALERGLSDTDWVRFEFQLRNDNATSWYLNWVQTRDVGKLYAGHMIDYLRFVQPPRKSNIQKLKKDRNQGLLPTTKWWSSFIVEAEKISMLYLPGEQYTLQRVENYLKRCSYSSLNTYLIAHDGDLTELLNAVKHTPLNAKQKILIDELRMMEAEREGKKHENDEHREIEIPKDDVLESLRKRLITPVFKNNTGNG